MTKTPPDNELKARFHQLRESETQAAPRFRRSVNRSAEPIAPGPLRPAWQFALAALVLAVIGSTLVYTGAGGPTEETARTAPSILEDLAGMERIEMPTDFLLDTPWYDLASTTPDFDFDDPIYDIPEEPSDEA